MNKKLAALHFDNRFTRELPADHEVRNTRRQVKDACYSRVLPTAVAKPTLVSYSREVAEMLGLDFNSEVADEFARVFVGNQLLEGMDPFAMCYGGHQFGNWAGQLGDGRAINLGEVVNDRGDHLTLQLKGAGPTPYSRTADGLAVLRSSVREFLCSEAMHHLGVPTTRALSLVLTGERVVRDMFYDGNPERELGAVVCRVAPSFVRFGNFEIFTSRGDTQTLKKLVDFTIRHDFPHLCSSKEIDGLSKEIYTAFFEEVCSRTAKLIVHWMRVGFVHGVMNTDNMSILGLTIDYGPYGWLEDYNPNWTPNTTDATHGRYCFGAQPQIGQWNLVQLANALYPLIDEAPPLQQGLAVYADVFQAEWKSMMASKLGLSEWINESDEELVEGLLEVLQLVETDMTIFYRLLANISASAKNSSDIELVELLMDAYYDPTQQTPETIKHTANWIRSYIARVQGDGVTDSLRRVRMNSVNPKFVLRNYLAQLAIDKADGGDFTIVNELLDVLRKPYEDQPGKEQYAEKRPEWARHRPGCSMLSCSS